MLTTILRTARPVVQRSAHSNASRALCTTATRRSDPGIPPLYGPGGQAGLIPTSEEQATGLERFEVLSRIQGVAAFDTEPLDSSRVGTLDDPIKVYSLDVERVVGCTGSPADSHELHWFTLRRDKNRRCPECGSVYALDFYGKEGAEHHH
ncbi:cytochrome c oxidase polypeptide IV [Phlebopus sp. FC_14]|nr:cytochrome c oxidase polypeptide IV [Phlebopus sp. FC_14]